MLQPQNIKIIIHFKNALWHIIRLNILRYIKGLDFQTKGLQPISVQTESNCNGKNTTYCILFIYSQFACAEIILLHCDTHSLCFSTYFTQQCVHYFPDSLEIFDIPELFLYYFIDVEELFWRYFNTIWYSLREWNVSWKVRYFISYCWYIHRRN